MILLGIKIFFLAIIQNVAFTTVSRSRNRDNKTYHFIASIFSNTLWFFVLKELIMVDMDYIIGMFYVAGTVTGAMFGVQISKYIEKILGATSDSHIKPVSLVGKVVVVVANNCNHGLDLDSYGIIIDQYIAHDGEEAFGIHPLDTTKSKYEVFWDLTKEEFEVLK